MNPGEVLKIPEVVERLRLSRSKIYELMQTGELPSLKVGRSRRVLASDVEAFLRRCRVAAPREATPAAGPA